VSFTREQLLNRERAGHGACRRARR
jgi:hypothetical protein